MSQINNYLNHYKHVEFQLPKSVLKEYLKKKAPFGFGGLGEFVYKRTYARIVENDDGTSRLESWAETVYRVVNGTYTMQKRHITAFNLVWDEEKAQKSAREMFDLIFNFKFTPPGRGLWAMGTSVTQEKGLYAALNNCFTADTKFYARDPVRNEIALISFSDMFCRDMDTTTLANTFVLKGDNRFVQVLSRDGVWRTAVFNYFGNRHVNDITFSLVDPTGIATKNLGFSWNPSDSNSMSFPTQIHVSATPNHRWFVEKTNQRIIGDTDRVIGVTDQLAVGNVIFDHAGNRWQVTNITPRRDIQPVFCATEPTTGSFTLEWGLITGNCAFVSTKDIATERSKPFRFLMDMSMAGVGVGFDTAGAGMINVHLHQALWTNNRSNDIDEEVKKYLNFIAEQIADMQSKIVVVNPNIPNNPTANDWMYQQYLIDLNKYVQEANNIRKKASMTNDNGDKIDFTVHVVDDCREGWVVSTGLLIDKYLSEKPSPYILFDYTKIRPPGVPLKTFGGRASGPMPLLDLHLAIHEVFARNGPNPITITSIVDIMNLIGKAVIAGNVRRCVPTGTRVHVLAPGANEKSPNFILKKIEDMTPKDRVITHYGIYPVAKVIKQDMMPVVKITFEGGRAYRFSTMHRLRVRHFAGQDCHQDIPAGVLMPGTVVECSVHGIPSDEYKQQFSSSLRSLFHDEHGIVPDGLYGLRITEVIQETDMQVCYDLQIANPEVPYYATEIGIVNHNSSEIALGDWSSEEFRNLKDYSNPNVKHRESYGWASNNSVYGTENMDFTEIADLIAKNGEPGIFWLDRARNYSRMCDPPDYKDARALGTNPCSEQTLEAYELCCLVECFLNNHKTKEEFLHTLKYAYLYAKTVTLGQSHWPETNQVLMRNRRIGCSITGFAQLLARVDRGELRQNEIPQWLREGYEYLQHVDKEYSNWFGIPRSIKTTSVKPSGCVTRDTRVILHEHTVLSNKYTKEQPLYNTMTMESIFAAEGINIDNYVTSRDQWFDIKNNLFYVVNGLGEPEMVTKLYINGVDEVFQLEFDNGVVVKCTGNHRVLTRNRGWVAARDLTVDDDVEDANATLDLVE